MDISSVLINAYSSAENHTALINRAYKNLRLLQPFEITACGPSKPDDNHVVPRRQIIDGLALQHASTNPNQGVWLSRIAAFACRERSQPIRVLELGTCAGISAMYLLAGMSTQCGGKLTTFEGCSELAGLARQNLDEFIAAAKLTNVEYEVVVGPIDETLPQWLKQYPEALSLAFVDGNHQEKNTLDYHARIRKHSQMDCLMVHDDISWGVGMKNAWAHIRSLEPTASVLEFHLGGKPSRGLLINDSAFGKRFEIVNMDGYIERLARKSKSLAKRARLLTT